MPARNAFPDDQLPLTPAQQADGPLFAGEALAPAPEPSRPTTQRQLFAQAVKPRIRHDATRTSRVAAERAELSAAEIAWRILGLVATTPLNADECAERMLDRRNQPTPWQRVRPRATCLLAAKLIRRTGEERDSVLKNPMAVLEATPLGREMLARVPRPHEPCELYHTKPSKGAAA